MDYRYGLILFRSGRGISLRCTGMCVERDRVLFFNGQDLMAVVPIIELKAAIFADIDKESIRELCAEDDGLKLWERNKE